MADDEKYKVPLFDGSNYSNWKFRMQILLEEHDLFDLVGEELNTLIAKLPAATAAAQTPVLKRNDKKCKSLITQRISDSHLEYVKEKDTAYDMWKALSDSFERTGVSSQLRLRKTLLTMRYAPTESMASHFLKFDKLVRELKSTGAKIEEIDIVCHLLLTMPEEYDMVVTALETMSSGQLTLSFVKTRLLDEEAKRGGSTDSVGVSSSTVFSATTNKRHGNRNANSTGNRNANSTGNRNANNKRSVNSNGNSAGTRRTRFDYRCHHCGIVGHKRSECRKLKNEDKNSETANAAVDDSCNKNQKAFVFFSNGSDSSVSNVNFVLDSGSTEHLSTEKTKLINVRKLTTPINIRVAKSGHVLTANKVGNLRVRARVNGKISDIVITGILSVAGLECNLLSVRKLEMSGFSVIFEDGKGIIKKGNKVAAIAHRKDKLYELCVESVTETANVCKISETTQLWHRRLGHLSSSGLKKLVSMADGIDVKELETSSELCETCVEGKQTRLPHQSHRIRAKRPLELVHSDLCGPMDVTSFDGKRYLLTFIDDFTHFTVAYTLKAKSEVLKHFKMFQSLAETHFNFKVSRFRCDNGREYLSTEIRQHFEDCGIQFELTIPYTPQQNGVAERMNRTIIEKARCMILNSKMSKIFWSEAVIAAVYLINRCPTNAVKGKLPAELWYGEKPNLRKLRVFGCVAHLHIPKELINGKFESRSKRCRLMGYCANGYRLWCPESSKILLGRDVIFNESKFTSESEDFYDDFKSTEEAARNQESPNSGEQDISSDEESEYFDSAKEEDDNRRNTTLEDEAGILRKSSRKKNKPKYLNDYTVLALSAESFVEDVPQHFDDIQGRDDERQWMDAINEEITSLVENKTWDLISLPPEKKVIDNRWVFKIKRDKDGNIDKYKARLVVKGCSQRKGLDYEETYAPVARLTTVRTLLSIVNELRLKTRQLDVKNAFLHGTIDEEIYMKLPQGFTQDNGLVCKLNRSLYGLKQAPRAWNARFNEFILTLGFKRSERDHCLYIATSKRCRLYLLLYVDDIIIAGQDEIQIQEIVDALKKEFAMTDIGEIGSFLGIKIEQTSRGLFLSQRAYMEKMLTRFGMTECNSSKSPMEANPEKQENDDGEVIIEIKPYRELVGCLMFLMLNTRPDISVTVNYYSRFQNNAKLTHWKGLKRVLRYIRGTLDYGLLFKRGLDPETPLQVYVDANWATDNDRKSTTGFLLQVFGSTVAWSTKKQTGITLSSTEAEYVALATALTEAIWLKGLLEDFNVNSAYPIAVFEDNQSVIHLLSRWEHRRLKHVDVKYNFVRNMYQSKEINVHYVNTKEQTADILTKSLTGDQFVKLRSYIGVCKV